METIKISGTGSLNGGEYGDISSNGVLRITSDISASNVAVDGTTKCDGTFSAKKLTVDGTMKVEKNLRAGELAVDGMLTVRGAKTEADRITCDGFLSAGGQVSADEINADGYIAAAEIVGDSIVIRSHVNKLSRIFIKHSEVGLIEATSVDISGVAAKKVSGENVRIGPGCRIGAVDCSKKLVIDRTSSVGTVSGGAERTDV